MHILSSFLSYLRIEVSGWKKAEVLWLVFSVGTAAVVSVLLDDAFIGMLSAAAGICASVLTGKGKTSAYIIGSVNAVLYSVISFNAGFYGEVMLKLFVFIPFNIAGVLLWSRHINAETKEVVKRCLKNRTRLIIMLVLVPAVYFFGLFLEGLGDPMPYIDSFTTVLSVAALVLAVNRYAEQWWLWVVINVFSIVLWCQNIVSGGTNYAALVMFTVYLANSVIMAVRWQKEGEN